MLKEYINLFCFCEYPFQHFMGPFTAILIALGGIVFAISIFQVMILFRKRSAIVFFFGSVLSLVYLLFVVITYLTFKYQSIPSNLLSDLKIQLIILQVVILAFIGVTYLLLGIEDRVIILSAIIIVAIEVALSFFLPEKVLFGEDPALSLIVMGTGERFLMLAPGFHLWRLLIDLSVFTYLVYLSIFLSKSLYKFTFYYLIQVASGAGIVFIVALFDQMIDLGSVQFYYLMPFGLFVNYFILTYIPFSHLMKEVFSHFEKVDREKKWHRLIDHANVIIVVLNRMGHVDFINPFFLKLTGYKEAEVIGKDWFEFFVPSDQYYDVQSAFIEILEFDFHPNYRNPIITKYQEKRMIDWYNVRLRDANDHVTGSVSIGIDITDDDAEMSSLKQKLAEAEELINQMRKEGKIS